MTKFNDGDVVNCKAGGPLMTVEDLGEVRPVGEENIVSTIWFDCDGSIHRDRFASISLQKWRIVED